MNMSAYDFFKQYFDDENFMLSFIEYQNIDLALLGEFQPSYMVSVLSDEGPVPHFHIDNEKTGEKCCIRIDAPEYFNHSKGMTKFLTDDDKKQLVKWLNSVSDEFQILNHNFDINFFRNICVLWNQNNPEWRLDLLSPMPDYLKLD